MGATARRRPPADARHHRDRRQDDDDPAHGRHAWKPRGVRSVAAGNTDVPLVEAIDLDVDVFVVECTSFRLAWTEHFRGEAAAWLNLAPDHLNWHRVAGDLRGGEGQDLRQPTPDRRGHRLRRRRRGDAHLATSPGRRVTFGQAAADYRVEDGLLVSPHGEIAPVASMRRSLPTRCDQRPRRCRPRPRIGIGRRLGRRHRASVRSSDRRIASSSSPRQMASPGSTTRRRRPRTPRLRRSTASTTSSSSPVGATRGSTWRRWPPRRSGSAPSSPSARRRTTSPRRSPPPALPC